MTKILFLGDVVGRVGRRYLQQRLGDLKSELGADVIVVNGENAAGGVGIDPTTADELFRAGADVITTGNHVWNRREVYPYLAAKKDRIVRPLNYAPGAPGEGVARFRLESGVTLVVVNLLGRVFVEDYLDCPFRAVDELLKREAAEHKLILVDMHGEATSEKIAMGYFLDGRVTAVVGTHTHVQTADARILKGGTACMTDAGMCGPYDSVLGMASEVIVQRFVSGLPVRFDVAKGLAMINGVLITADESTGKAQEVLMVREIETPPSS